MLSTSPPAMLWLNAQPSRRRAPACRERNAP